MISLRGNTEMPDCNDADRGIQALRVGGRFVGGRGLNFADHIHPPGYPAERGEPLTIRVARAAKIE